VGIGPSLSFLSCFLFLGIWYRDLVFRIPHPCISNDPVRSSPQLAFCPPFVQIRWVFSASTRLASQLVRRESRKYLYLNWVGAGEGERNGNVERGVEMREVAGGGWGVRGSRLAMGRLGRRDGAGEGEVWRSDWGLEAGFEC